MKSWPHTASGIFVGCWLFTGLAAADEPPGATLDAGPYRVTSTPGHRISITVTHDLPPTEGVVYIPLPPNSASQSVVACKLKVVSDRRTFHEAKTNDLGPLKKPVREVVLKQPVAGKAIAEVDIELFAAEFEPGRPQKPVHKLADAERAALTAAGWNYEFETAHFRAWMAENSLKRGKSERDADFALRVLAFLRRHFEYKIADPKEMQEKIARLKTDDLGYFISEKSTECWGLSRIYTGLLRSNGVPCRQMSGYMLEANAARRGGHHVRTEVYLDGTGWIIVEVAGAVTARDAPLLTFFGHRGDDMVLMTRGINYELSGPKDPGRIGTFSGFAIGNAGNEWSFPSGSWEIRPRR